MALSKTENSNNLQHINSILRAIRNVNQLIVTEKDRGRLIRKTCRLLNSSEGFVNAWIILFDRGGEYIDAAQAGVGKDFNLLTKHIKAGKQVNCFRQATSKQAVISIKNPFSECTDCPLHEKNKNISALSVQIYHKTKAYGLLTVSVKNGFYSNKDVRELLKEVAGDIAFALYSIEIETAHQQAQKAIRINEARFRTTLYSIGDAVITTDIQGNVQEMNPVAEQLTGWNEDEAVGKPLKKVFKIINEETRKPVENPVERVLREGVIIGLANHTLLISKSGSETPIADSGAPVWNDAGEISGVVLVFRDQTKERAVQQAIMEAKVFAENIVATIREPLLVLDESLKVISANSSFYSNFRVEEAETIGRPVYEIGNRQWSNPKLRELLEEILLHNTSFNDFEIQHNFEHIGTRTMLLNARRVQNTPDKPLLILLAIEDITERSKAEKKLTESYKIINRSPAVIFLWKNKPGWPVEYVSENVQNLLGFTAQEFLNGSISYAGLIYNEDTERVAAEVAAKTQETQIQNFSQQYRLVCKNGRVIWVDDRTWVQRNAQGDITHFQGIILDITDRKKTEENLRDSEANYRALFQGISDAVFVHPLKNEGFSNFVAVNDAACKRYGYTHDEFLKLSPKDISDPEDTRLRSSRVGRKELLTKKWMIFEARHITKEGISFPVEISSRVFDLKGQKVVMSMARDITERKKADHKIRESEERFRLVFHTIPDVVSLSSLSDGTYIDVNKTFNELTGYSRDEALGKSTLDLNIWKNPQDRVRFISLLKKNGSVDNMELEFRTKHGKIINGLLSAGIVQLNQENVILSIFHDITDRKQVEAERERLAIGIENAAESVVITDINGDIQYVNPAFEQITGYSKEEVMGANPRFLKSGKHEPDFYTHLWNTITSGQIWRGKFINKRKNGELYNEETTISPVHDSNDKISNFVAVKRDVTKEEELEQQVRQAQKMDSIGRLAGGVAHDFNNMLSVILGYSELALTKLNPEDKLYKDIQEIHKAGKRSADLTTQLLAFSRKQTIAPRVLNLNDAVSSMLKMLRRLIGEDINLIWKPGPNLGNIRLDPAQIDQILANLCVNARDAIEGTGNIIIETQEVDFDEDFCQNHSFANPGRYIQLMVSDDGCGMDEEIKANIFEPFFTTKAQGAGTGLGLAMVYGIVKQNNGIITVYSEKRQGSSFKLYFPLHKAPEEDNKSKDKEQLPKGNGELILLVEDEPSILELTKAMIEKLGYSVIATISTEEALILAAEQEKKIDLLLSDVVMPVMNGKQLADHLLKINPDMKVLFMSGYTSDVIANRGVLEEGINFINKPFSRSQLAQKLQETIKSATT